ncbi:MAG TPA: TonB-dependent receptor [Longimicrobium sp.]|nr:TonB-dependent receptor [Longimicrobium sp.]
MRRARIVSAVAAALLWACTLLPPGAEAQTTTGRIRGYVRGPGGDVAGATVTARNTETNQRRQATSTGNGFYVLPGLRPGPYEITVQSPGFGAQRRGLQLLVGQTVDANFDLAEQTVTLEALDAVAPAVETRTSEVATNVTREQIEGLPSADRNFLGLAVLAPGTRLQDDRLDGTRKTFTAGAQPAEQVNVFIDGASYKNDLLQGGVAGQDASRGNPFPRNAIREFRIITQNFKAEYQKASSAIITATTRSGTNRWETDGFLNYQDRGLVELDRFQSRDRQNNPDFTRPDYDRVQVGANLGGPIIADRLHFFGSFERNVQNRARRVDIVPPSGYPALDTIDFASRNGEFDEPFRATLLFGKLTYEHNPASFFELSYHGRHENDVRDFGGNTAFEAATRFRNDVHTGILKHTWTRGDLLNEATVSLQDYFYNPQPNTPGPINRLFGFGCCAQIGGFVSDQDFRQLRASVRNDLTWSGLRWAGEHVLKGGVNVDFLDYDVVKRNAETPRFVYEPWYFGFAFPNKVEFQTGDPNFGARNTQLGLYLQDDWSPTERLVLNLGVRWDFETHMMNYDYETPGDVADSLTKYQDRLFLPLDPDRYFTDGDDRKPFYGAIQPRLGFSFALDSEARTSVFGGWGIFYDRTLFDHALEEAFALQHPSYTLFFAPPGGPVPAGQVEWDERYFDRDELLALLQDRRFNTPEVKLLPNDLRPPKAQHFNLGVRRAFGSVEASASYNAVRSKNILTFYWADQGFVCPQRAFGVPGCFENRDIPGWGTILFGDDAGKTWYDALQVKVDRPYARSAGRSWGWGAGLAVTVAERETQGFNDLFSFAQAVDYPRQVRNDEPLRIVGNWVVDLPFAGGLQFSGLLNLGSGTRQDVGGRADSHNPNTVFEPGGFEPGTEPFLVDAFAYRMLDVRFRKDFVSFRGSRIGVAADVFNVFNFDNLGCFNTFNREDANFGRAGCTVSDPRRLQIGVEYRAGGR